MVLRWESIRQHPAGSIVCLIGIARIGLVTCLTPCEGTGGETSLEAVIGVGAGIDARISDWSVFGTCWLFFLHAERFLTSGTCLLLSEQ